MDLLFIDMSFDPSRPFDALPPLPPKAKLQSTGSLKACIAVRPALAELKALGQLLLDSAS